MAVITSTEYGLLRHPSLRYPFLCWRMPSVTATATSAASGFGASLAVNFRTYDAWKPTAAPGTLTLTFASAQDLTYVGIGAHTAGTAGATLTIEAEIATVWTEIAEVEPETDDAILVLFEEVSATAVRIIVSDAVCELGVVMTGMATEIPSKASFLGTPISESMAVEYQDNRSVTGNFLGRTVRADGLNFTLEIANLPETWRATEWAEFKAYTDKGEGVFFIAPKPGPYPDDVALAWATGSPRFERVTANRLLSGAVTLNCRGYRAP